MSLLKVSIVVPVYHVAPYVLACLESIARQTYKDIEVLFVDDCGTDNSIRLIEEYLASHSFPECRIIRHECNRGLSAARNTGLHAATGDYVYFLDSDDEISPACIERLVAPLTQNPYEVVIGSVCELYENGEKAESLLCDGEIAEPLKAYAQGDWYVMAWNKLCRRDFLLTHKLYFKEGMLHEDVPWSFQLACLCRAMYAVGETTYYYKVRAASIMTSLSIENDVQIYLQAFAEIKRFIEERQFMYNPFAYQMVEGKKSGILYSLLQKGEGKVFRKYYPAFHQLRHVSPWEAYKRRMIGLGYLLRDFHYCLPQAMGRIYKALFYLFFYGLRGKRVQGAVWK